jgi:hypothetical protein
MRAGWDGYVVFCLMQQILIEIPLLGYVFAPESTQERVTRFRTWMARKGRTAAVIGAATIGIVLIARGLITLLQSSLMPQLTQDRKMPGGRSARQSTPCS